MPSEYTRAALESVSSYPLSSVAAGHVVPILAMVQVAVSATDCDVTFSSFYRDPAANAAAGGSKFSDHLSGQCLDYVPDTLSVEDFARRLVAAHAREGNGAWWGQLIVYPYDSRPHIHESLAGASWRYGEILVAVASGKYVAWDGVGPVPESQMTANLSNVDDQGIIPPLLVVAGVLFLVWLFILRGS